jgi:uncharacterized protein (TIGR02145 family)
MKDSDKIQISNPATGLLVYCTDCSSNGELQYYDGRTWVNMMGFVSPVLEVITITASSATSLTVQSSVKNEGTYSVTSRGFVIALDSTNNPPDTSNKLIESSKLAGTGTFSSTITNLVSGTTLNIRAYASVNTGTLTYSAYSSIKKFDVQEGGVYATITSPTGKVWMDRNLGANRVAQTSTDAQSYGGYFQWGRNADGHQSSISTTTTIPSNWVTNSGLFIRTSTADWKSVQNNNLWQGVNGVNNPCPIGFRVPTKTEFDAESVIINRTTNYISGAFDLLKLPLAGYRISSTGLYAEVGVNGRYYTSTYTITPTIGAVHYLFNSTKAGTEIQNLRANGFSVRCIQD